MSPCCKKYFVVKDPATGIKMCVTDIGGGHYLWNGPCEVTPPLSDCCTSKSNECSCLEITPSDPERVGYDPDPSAPVVGTFFLPRYAKVKIEDSDAFDNFEAPWEIWTPTACDETVAPFGKVTATLNTFTAEFVDPCTNGTNRSGTITIEWTGSAFSIDCTFTAPDCISFDGCNGGKVGNEPLQIRYRREYEDWITKEVQNFTMAEECSFGGSAYSNDISLIIEFDNSCRSPATDLFCICVEPTYLVTDIQNLSAYTAPPIDAACSGAPIDIDEECGDISQVSLWGLFYTPFPFTVPVIDGKAYDTLQVDIPDNGAIVETVFIRTFNTPTEARNWVCDHLRFATVGTGWPGNANDLEYDWPYNDLYFNACTVDADDGGDPVPPGIDGVINLVPC